MNPRAKSFIEDVFDLHENELFCIKSHFDIEAQGNSEMAYYHVLAEWVFSHERIQFSVTVFYLLLY